MKIRINKSYEFNNNSINFILEENKILISITDIFYSLDGKSNNHTGSREIVSSLKRCFKKIINHKLTTQIENNEIKNIWLEHSLALEYAGYIDPILGDWCKDVIDRLKEESNQLFLEAKQLIDDTPLRLCSITDLVKEINRATIPETSSNKESLIIVDDMPKDGNIEAFTYNKHPVSFYQSDTESMINISDVIKIFNRDILEWFNLTKTTSLLNSYKAKGRIAVARRVSGLHKPTIWMSEEVALNLASWLDSEFRLWCGSRIKEMFSISQSKQ